MSKAKMARVAGFTVALGATASLVGFAATSTGAYFSDAKTGNAITGTMGSIRVTGADGGGTNHLDIAFTDMLPGDAQSKTVHFSNTGENPEDVWVVFDQTALGSGDGQTGINSMGHYGEVHVASGGTELFGSKNLNDNASSCPPAAPGSDCNPVPHMIKLSDSLAPGATSDMSFSFTPGAAFKHNADLPVLNLPYTLVATQHGIAPDNALNGTVVH